jgi:hypothetical protein
LPRGRRSGRMEKEHAHKNVHRRWEENYASIY